MQVLVFAFDAFTDSLLLALASQVTSSLSLPHTASSRCLKAIPNLARPYMTGALPEQRTLSSSTVTILSRSVVHSTRTVQYYVTTAKYSRFLCLSQKDEIVPVDGEVATILTQSRFKENFTCQPPGGSCEPSCADPKVSWCFSLH